MVHFLVFIELQLHVLESLLFLVEAVIHHYFLVKFDWDRLISIGQGVVSLLVICFVVEWRNVVFLVNLEQLGSCARWVHSIQLGLYALDSPIIGGGVNLDLVTIIDRGEEA